MFAFVDSVCTNRNESPPIPMTVRPRSRGFMSALITFGFLGGNGAQVGVHPAELLDDSVPETAGCQALVAAHAGTAPRISTHLSIWRQFVLFIYFSAVCLIAGSRGGKRLSKSTVQAVRTALLAHHGPPSCDHRGPLPHELS